MLKLIARIGDYESNISKDIIKRYRFKPKDMDELKKVVDLYCSNEKEEIEIYGLIGLWDVSNVTDMYGMFHHSGFNGNISGWNVSNVTNMCYMFNRSKFNGDISSWDVSNVTTMNSMFSYSKFNGDLSDWNVSNVTNMNWMFHRSNFNVSAWDVGNVTEMYMMFYGCLIEERYKPIFMVLK